MPTIPLRERPSWKALEQHHADIGGRHLRNLFAEEPDRGERLRAEAAGLYLDYSKNRITDDTLRLLLQLARDCQLERRRDLMFAGAPINTSEHRRVLHVALRIAVAPLRRIAASSRFDTLPAGRTGLPLPGRDDGGWP